ncbi:MAG: hypothetical protein JNJ40_16530 [Bacteroidia bacterium]|nr:hypothetical protein [Bacteroidia bacterium]
MKKTITAALLIAATALIENAQAQGLLGKLKDKVGQAGTAGFGGGEKDWNGFALPAEKDGQKDLADTKLDGTTFTKDKLDISGIYISQKAIGLSSDLSRGIEKTIQKFAVQASADYKKIVFTHTGMGNIIKGFAIYPVNEQDQTKADLKLLEKGIIHNLGFTSMSDYQVDAIFTDSIDYNEKPAKHGVSIKSNLSMLEPGVFVMHPFVSPKNGVTTCAGGSEFRQYDENYAKYHHFNLVYKQGKNVSKWTNEAIIKELMKQSDLNCSLRLAGYAANATMPEKVTGFKDEPTAAILLKAAQGRAKSFGWKETITAVYPTGEWRNEYKLLGVNQLNTLTARYLNTTVIMKTPSGECAIETMIMKQDNIFTTGSTDEKFTGKPIYGDSNGDLTPIGCEKTKQQ